MPSDDSARAPLLPLIAPAWPTGSKKGERLAGSDSEKSGRDRRASPRLQVELECEERYSHARYFRITWDLSTFGLSTRGTSGAHQVGERLDLRLYLPDGDPTPLDVRAEVVGEHLEGDGLRVAFKNPPVEAIRRISRYVASRIGEREEGIRATDPELPALRFR